MVKIINPFRGVDPIAQTISDLGAQMFGGDQITPAIKREQLLKLQRENVETGQLANQYRLHGTPNYNRNDIAMLSTLAGQNPQYAADMDRYLTVNAGTQGDAASRAFNAAGGAWSGTSSGFNADQTRQSSQAANALAEYARQADATLAQKDDQYWNEPMPVLGNTLQPTYAPRSALTPQSGYTGIMTNAERQGTLAGQMLNNPGGMGSYPQPEQRYVGADAGAGGDRKPFNVRGGDGNIYLTPDGVSDVYGRTIPIGPNNAAIGIQDTAEGAGLTTATQTQVQQQEIAFNEFSATLQQARDISRDPSIFGVTGNVRYGLQQAGQIAQNMGMMLSKDGKGLDQSVATIFNETSPGVQSLISVR